MLRRSFIVAGIGCTVFGPIIRAQQGMYPTHPVKMVVAFPAGNGADAMARAVARNMSNVINQSIYIDNRPGNAAISHGMVKTALPDGYTLLIASNGTLAINPNLFSKLPYDPIKDFEGIGTIAGAPNVLYTRSDHPVSNLTEMLQYTKARPGMLTAASIGIGTTGHLSMEMLKTLTGIDIIHVPFKGSADVFSAIVGGQVDFAFDSISAILPFGQSGRIKMLGITSKIRSPTLKDLPTISEQGISGFESIGWAALLAPKGTPREIVNILNSALNQSLKDPQVLTNLLKNGSFPMPSTAIEFDEFLAKEIKRWGLVVRAANINMD